MTNEKDDALEWALKQFEAILYGYAERLADERFDAGYAMGLRHSIRIVEIAKAEALSHDAVLARIGLRMPAEHVSPEEADEKGSP